MYTVVKGSTVIVCKPNNVSGTMSDEMRFLGMCDTTKNSIAYCQKYHDTLQYHT